VASAKHLANLLAKHLAALQTNNANKPNNLRHAKQKNGQEQPIFFKRKGKNK